MTAIRVTEPSGSNGAIQFANNGVFDTDAGLIFNTTTQRLGVGTAAPDTLLHVAGQTTVGSAASDLHSVTGSLSVSVGLTGSLTHLTDGSSFLLAGTNMVITTGSNGAVTLEADNISVTTVSADTATRTKRTYDLTSGVAADTNYVLTQINLSDAGHDPNYIDVLVNGVLLHSGTAAQVTSGDTDYSVVNDTTLRFAFDLRAADIIDVTLITSGAAASPVDAPYVTFEASGDLTSERVLTAGAGLAVSVATTGQVAMSIDRIKTVYTVTGSQHQSGIPLTVTNAAFDSGSYDEHRIDLFVNGQFMVSGSNSDYTLHGNTDGVVFNFNLFQNDRVVSIVQ